MNRQVPNFLMVEGDEEKRTLPYLAATAGLAWGPKGAEVIHLESYGGIENILAEGAIEAQLKASGRVAVGIVVDADSSLEECWKRIRQRVVAMYPNIPLDLPSSGLVHVEPGKPRLGIWIMPDNASPGMLETLLFDCRKPLVELEKVLEQSLVEAKKNGARFTAAQTPKARLHTWLSWQDPPGLQLHVAVARGFFEPGAVSSVEFTSWLKKVFELP